MPDRFRQTARAMAQLQSMPLWIKRHISISINFFLEGDAKLDLSFEIGLGKPHYGYVHFVTSLGVNLGFYEPAERPDEVWILRIECEFFSQPRIAIL